MRIVMLSDLETAGGAAIAASRLADALSAAGHEVIRIVNEIDGRGHSWQTIQLPFSPYARAVRGGVLNYAGRTLAGRTWQSCAGWLFQRNLRAVLAEIRPDLVNIHNLHAAFWAGWSDKLVQICAGYAPTIWTLHDMWSFTGRCTYSYDCRKFVAGCDIACPSPMEYPALAPVWIRGAWERRRHLLAACPTLVAVTPSGWLAEEAKTGLWMDHRVVVIPNGLPLGVYGAVDRQLARAALGIDQSGPVILVAAQHLADRRKGSYLLSEALGYVPQRPLTVLTLGTGRVQFEAEGLHVHELGYIDHERTRVLAYNAADFLIHPAPVDNLPNVVMEAIACGTPVVGFRVGGVPEMVRSGQTGWLAEDLTPMGLAASICNAISDLARGAVLRDSCLTVAKAEYGVDLQAQRYITLGLQLAHHDGLTQG